ncbi:MAG: PspC domain-containing protein [Cyclobacteriaceae bacterium]
MKKNISINISGIIFHIEEDGYEVLRKYLDSVNRYFSSFEDSSEILADIEGRIAEIFLSKLSDGKQVITHEDVNSLIATMGSVSDFKAAEEQEFPAGQEPAAEQRSRTGSKSSNASRRLYRDQKRKILGGVCAGLAHYFNIDPVWPRLLFALLVLGSYGGLIIVYLILWIALPVSAELEEEGNVKKMFRDSERKVVGGVAAGVAAFFGGDVALVRILFVVFTFVGGLGFLVYIILWIALPEAKSITEKMQMQGEPVTLSNIESTVKKSINEKDTEDESVLAKIILFPFRLIAFVLNGLAKVLGPLLSTLVDVLRVAIGIVITLIGISFLLSMVIMGGVFLGLFSVSAIPMWWEINITELGLPLEAMRNAFPSWTIIFGFILGFIPSLAITLIGVSIIAKKVVFNSLVGWTMFVLFFISLAVLSFKIPQIAYAFKEEGEYRVEQTYEMGGKVPQLTMREVGLDDYDVTTIRFIGHEDSNIRIVERFEAQGNTRKIAGENAQMVDYTITQNDSILVFDSNITFKPNAKFRAQRLDIDVYMPFNKPFVIEESLWRLIESYARRYRYDYDGQNTWIITSDGLECQTCESSRRPAPVISDQYGFDNFDQLDVTGVVNVRVYQGSQYSVEMKGSPDQRRLYDVFVSNNTLVIDYDDDNEFFWKRNFIDDDHLLITITMPHLTEIKVRGAGKLSFSGFDENSMEINFVGAVAADGNADVRNLTIDMTGASFLDLNGNGDFLEADLTGASGLRAYNFETREAIIEAHGASTAKVYVSDRLEIKKGFASSVSHRGNPEVIKNF